MTSIGNALLPGGRLYRWFVASAALILCFTAVVKFMSFVEGGELLNRTDPVLGVRFSPLFFVVAMVELLVAALAVAWRNDISSGILLAGLSSVFMAYRLTIYSLGWQGFCPCLGNFSNWSGINNHQLGTIMTFVAAYLFLGSLFLCAVNRRKTTPQAETRHAPSLVVTLFIMLGIVSLPGASAQSTASSYIVSGIAEDRLAAHTGAIISKSTNRFQALVSGESWAIRLQPSVTNEVELTLIYDGDKLVKRVSQDRNPPFPIKVVTNQVFDFATAYPGQWPIFDGDKVIAVWLLACSYSSYATNEAGAPTIPPRFAVPAMIQDPAFKQSFRARYFNGQPRFLLDFESTIGEKLCLVIGLNQFKCYDAFVKEFGYFTNIAFQAGVLTGSASSYPQSAEYVFRMADKPGGRKKIWDSMRVDLTEIMVKPASPSEWETMMKLPTSPIIVTDTRAKPALPLKDQPSYVTTNGYLLDLGGRNLTAIAKNAERSAERAETMEKRRTHLRLAFSFAGAAIIFGAVFLMVRGRTGRQK